MNMQLRTILLGLLSLGFVQGYAQTFALQVKDDRITYLDDEPGFLISHTAVTRVPNRIFQMFAIPCLYLGQREIIQHVFNVLLTMSPHWFLMLPVSEEPFYWIRENFHYPKVFV